jgi:radical SAM protein with 4Fe4S-binding SPASM domain
MSGRCQSPDWVMFTSAEIARTVEARGLLSMELELTGACNFNCIYCYNKSAAAPDPDQELTDEEIRRVVRQAMRLGARSIVLLGGEPLLYPGLAAICEWMHGLDLGIDLFTNGTGLTPALAATLFRNDVRVVLKMNSRDAARQNLLAGHDTAHAIIQEAMANLRTAGYPSRTALLGISSILCRVNKDEIEHLWRWARTNDIEPYFERLNPTGNAILHQDELTLSPQEQGDLFNRLAAIDRTEFDREWTPQPPLVGNRCLRHKYSCTVKANGDVQPCVGVTCRLGNIREKPLSHILRDSEMMDALRHFEANIKGPCAECHLSAECYGCRGTAWQLTGDALASDPLCWRNAGQEIPSLPADAAPYVPQQPPMRLITRLLSVGEKTAKAEAVISPDAICMLPDATLDPSFFAELAAQTFGAGASFRLWRRNDGKPIEGLLLGMSGFRVFGTAHAGDTLTVTIRTTCEMDGFAVLNGCVTRGDETLAEGSLKVCHQPIPKEDDE